MYYNVGKVGIIEEPEKVLKACLNLHENLEALHEIIQNGKDYFTRISMDNKPSDITIIIEKTEIHTHRFILATHSLYFQNMFYNLNDLSPKASLTIKNTSVEAFKMLLQYMETGVLNMRQHEINIVVELFELCHRFDVLKLRIHIREYLCEKLDAPNVCKTLEIAKLRNMWSLEISCWNLIQRTICENRELSMDWSYEVLEEVVFEKKQLMSESKLYQTIVKLTEDPGFCSPKQKQKLLSKISYFKIGLEKVFEIVFGSLLSSNLFLFLFYILFYMFIKYFW